jgi:hypothetical protein
MKYYHAIGAKPEDKDAFDSEAREVLKNFDKLAEVVKNKVG